MGMLSHYGELLYDLLLSLVYFQIDLVVLKK
jgi:hypothetical protein